MKDNIPSNPKLRRWPAIVVLVAAALTLGGCEQSKKVARDLGLWQGGPPAAPATAPPRPVIVKPAPPPAATVQPPEVRTPPDAATPGPSVPGPAVNIEQLPPASLPPPHPEQQVVLTPPPGIKDITRVGLLVPLTGPAAGLGRALLNAAQLALFELGDDNFALITRDTKGTPEGAEQAAREVIEDGARLILGPLFASSVRVVAPVARADGLNVIAFSNDRSVAGGNVFVIGFLPEAQVVRIVSYARSRGISRFAALIPNSVYGNRVADAFARVVAAQNGIIYQVERYDSADEKSLSPLVRRLANYASRRGQLLARRKALEGKDDEASKRALKRISHLEALGNVGFQAVLIPEGGAKLRAIAPLLPFYDIDTRKVRLLGTVEWDEPALATEPALFGSWFPAPSPKAREGFAKLYSESYGRRAPRLASLAYDATALAVVLARGGGQEKFAIPALTAANGFSGIDGIFRLLPSGVVERGLAVKEMRSRHSRVIHPAPRTFEKLTD